MAIIMSIRQALRTLKLFDLANKIFKKLDEKDLYIDCIVTIFNISTERNVCCYGISKGSSINLESHISM